MTLLVTIKKGEDFFVDDRRFVLSVITPQELIVLSDDRAFIVGRDWEDVGGGVKLAVDRIGTVELRTAKVAITAPGKKVLRGKLYKRCLIGE